jgi:hypothetical protein
MQYKQAKRILMEVIGTPHVPTEVTLAAIRLFFSNSLPQLGPYTKRSTEQALWRLASDSTCSPEARWKALRKLLLAVKRSAQLLVSQS